MLSMEDYKPNKKVKNSMIYKIKYGTKQNLGKLFHCSRSAQFYLIYGGQNTECFKCQKMSCSVWQGCIIGGHGEAGTVQ